MPSKDLARWRDRLEAAKKVWVAKGIIGNRESSMRMLIEFYRSNQWQNTDMWHGIDAEDLKVVNKIFPVANAQQAELISRNPRVQYFARAEEQEDVAPAVKALHNYDIREQNHKSVLNAAFRDHQFAPFGHIRHGYTPEDELDTEATSRKRSRRMGNFDAATDRPWIRRVAPWNVLADPECESFDTAGGMRWVAYRDLMRRDDIRDNPKMTINRDDLSKLAGSDGNDWDDMRDRDVRNSPSPDAEDDVEIWTVYEIEERTWFQMTLSGVDDFLRKPDDWPIPWETLPGHFFQVNRQIDTPFSLSLMENQIPHQQELNQVRTLMHSGVLSGRPLNIASQAAFEDEDLTKMRNGAVNEFLFTKGGDVRAALERVQTGGIPNGSLELLVTVNEDMRESMGQSRMDRAQRINVETAEEAGSVQHGSDLHTGRIQEEFETFIRQVEQAYMQGRRQILAVTESTVDVKVLGEDMAGRLGVWKTVSPEDLHGDYEFEIEVGSTRKRDETQEAAKALADIQVGLSMPEGVADMAELWRRYAVARGIDPSEVTVEAARKQQDLARQAGVLGQVNELNQGAAPQGGVAGQQPIPPQLIAALGGRG